MPPPTSVTSSSRARSTRLAATSGGSARTLPEATSGSLPTGRRLPGQYQDLLSALRTRHALEGEHMFSGGGRSCACDPGCRSCGRGWSDSGCAVAAPSSLPSGAAEGRPRPADVVEEDESWPGEEGLGASLIVKGSTCSREEENELDNIAAEIFEESSCAIPH